MARQDMDTEAEITTTATGERSTGYLDRPAVLAAGIAMGSCFFIGLNPNGAVPIVLIASFIFLAVMLYSAMRLILVVSGLSGRISGGIRRGVLLTGTVLPVLLLMLQSIGQLTVRDVVTLGGLFLIGVFYASRVWRGR